MLIKKIFLQYLFLHQTFRKWVNHLKTSETAARDMRGASSTSDFFQTIEDLDPMESDLVRNVENFIKNRKLEQVKSENLQNQFKHLQEKLTHQESVLHQTESKSKTYKTMIGGLEDKLTNKQMEFDQLLEDFTKHRSNTQEEMDKLKSALSIEKDKFHQLQNKQKTDKETIEDVENRFKMTIQGLEKENQDLKWRFQELQREKKHLIDTFNEFTARLTTPLESMEDSKNPKI